MEAEDPSESIHQVAVDLRDEGVSQVVLYKTFLHRFTQLDSEDPLYDALADAMDLIWGGGWANGNPLYSEELNESRLRE